MKRSVLSVCICILFLFAFLTSFAFVAAEIGHDCIGEDCPICERIEICLAILVHLPVCILVSLSVFHAVFIRYRERLCPRALAYRTPVSRFDILNT